MLLDQDVISQLVTVVIDSLSSPVTKKRFSTMNFFKQQKTTSGTEGWFKWEVVHALYQAKYPIKLKDVIKYDCDLIINDIKIELKSTRGNSIGRLTKAIYVQHSRANLYMMLCGDLNTTYKKLQEELPENEYVIRPFSIKYNNWGIITVNRKH
jgi:alpha-glucuronidase